MSRMTRPQIVAGTTPPLRHPANIHDLRLPIAGRDLHKDAWIHHGFAVTGIGLVTRGRGTYQVDDGPVQTIEAGDMFAVWPGPIFHYGPNPGSTWTEYHVCGVGTGVRRWVQWGLVPADGKVHRIEHLDQTIEEFQQLMAIYKRGGPGDSDRAILMSEMLLLEIKLRRVDAPHQAPVTKAIERVLAYCEKHLAEPIDFQQLASDHAMSYSALRQRVRRAAGLPPGQYLIRLRCEAACRLLNQTALSVGEVGQQVGIDDPFAFSRTFKRCVGLSPRDFRRQSVGR